MANFTALYDACVLFPFSLRDLLMELATTGLFRARWTNEIHEEWMSAVHARHGVPREKLERIRDLMNLHAEQCLVTGYEPLIDSLTLPDPDDRHVLAAAIRTRAHVIVTFNLRDFPAEALAPFEIEAQHPDEFITHLLDLNAGQVVAAVRSQRARLKNPPMEAGELLDRFMTHGLPETAMRLREFEGSL